MTATTEPARITAGDTIAWTKTLSAYPANDGWSLTYTLINSAGRIVINATASGADHQVNVAAATSADYAAGVYLWQAHVQKSSDRFTIASGTIVVAPNLAAASTYDTRTSARKALDAVNAAMESYGSKAYLQSFEIAGRKQQFHSPGDFLAFRSRLMAEVAREDNAARLAAGLAPKNQIHVRFGRR